MRELTLFGVPLWFGKVKSKVAKKHLGQGVRWFWKNRPEFRAMTIGGVINDCSGLNRTIAAIDPFYVPVGRRGGRVLFDIDFTSTEGAGCSLISCGVEPARSQEQIEKSFIEHMDGWFFGEGGKTWYSGLDNPEHQIEIQRQILKYETVKNGGHIVDEAGRPYPQFMRPQ